MLLLPTPPDLPLVSDGPTHPPLSTVPLIKSLPCLLVLLPPNLSHFDIPNPYPHYRHWEPPLQTPLFVEIPIWWKKIIFAVIFVTKTKTIILTKTDDFVCDNLYDKDKDDYLTFFKVCFPLTGLRFLCVVLLFLFFIIVCDWFSKFEYWSLNEMSWVL